MSQSRNLQRQDRITVVQDGEEREVFNWINVDRTEKALIRGGNPSIERFDDDPEVGAGDSSMTPDAVTHWVAEELYHEFGVEPEHLGIDVIDPTDEGVDVL